jgi:hypothetical protein
MQLRPHGSEPAEQGVTFFPGYDGGRGLEHLGTRLDGHPGMGEQVVIPVRIGGSPARRGKDYAK